MHLRISTCRRKFLDQFRTRPRLCIRLTLLQTSRCLGVCRCGVSRHLSQNCHHSMCRQKIWRGLGIWTGLISRGACGECWMEVHLSFRHPASSILHSRGRSNRLCPRSIDRKVGCFQFQRGTCLELIQDLLLQVATICRVSVAGIALSSIPNMNQRSIQLQCA